MTSRLTQNPRVEVQATVQLNEAELRALEALVGYGTDAFLKAFYSALGSTYLKPHEQGLRSLFEVIKQDLNPILARVDAAKKAFNTKAPVVLSADEYNALRGHNAN